MLARNFYKFKLLALALAFLINVMLLFFKVCLLTEVSFLWLILLSLMTETRYAKHNLERNLARFYDNLFRVKFQLQIRDGIYKTLLL